MEPKTLAERIWELKGNPRYKVIKIVDMMAVYYKKFNQTNLELVFEPIDEEVVMIENNGDAIICGERYQISTLDEFITVCKALGVKIEIRALYLPFLN